MKVRKVVFTLDESITMRCLLGEKIDRVMQKLSRIGSDDKLMSAYWEKELETMKIVYGKLCCEMVDSEEN